MFAIDENAPAMPSIQVEVKKLDRVIQAGYVDQYGPAIRGHDGKTVYRAIAASPWRAMPEVFWCAASAEYWLRTIAAVEA